jgi:hypothetical protein
MYLSTIAMVETDFIYENLFKEAKKGKVCPCGTWKPTPLEIGTANECVSLTDFILLYLDSRCVSNVRLKRPRLLIERPTHHDPSNILHPPTLKVNPEIIYVWRI